MKETRRLKHFNPSLLLRINTDDGNGVLDTSDKEASMLQSN